MSMLGVLLSVPQQKCLAMSNLSDYAKDSIRQILSESGKVLAEDMEDVASTITRSSGRASS